MCEFGRKREMGKRKTNHDPCAPSRPKHVQTVPALSSAGPVTAADAHAVDVPREGVVGKGTRAACGDLSGQHGLASDEVGVGQGRESGHGGERAGDEAWSKHLGDGMCDGEKDGEWETGRWESSNISSSSRPI
jgi:hypothetical protein